MLLGDDAGRAGVQRQISPVKARSFVTRSSRVIPRNGSLSVRPRQSRVNDVMFLLRLNEYVRPNVKREDKTTFRVRPFLEKGKNSTKIVENARTSQ